MKFFLSLLLFPLLLLGQSSWEYESNYNKARSIVHSIDGGVLILAYPQGQAGTTKLFKLDRTGEKIWEHTLDDYSPVLQSQSIIEDTLTGDIYVGGLSMKWESEGGGYILKLNACGEMVWIKSVGLEEELDRVIQLYIWDNHLFALQYTGGLGNSKYTLKKYDTSGNFYWGHTYSEMEGKGGQPNEAIQCSDGGYLITGRANLPPYYDTSISTGHLRSTLLKTDSLGVLEWVDFYNWEEDTIGSIYASGGFSSVELKDSTFLSVGLARNSGSLIPMFVYKTDKQGNEIWSKPLANPLSSYDGVKLRTLNDSTLILATSPSDPDEIFDFHIEVFKLDTAGNILSSYVDTGDYSLMSDMKLTLDNKILVLPSSKFTNGFGSGQTNVYACKIDAQTMQLDSFLMVDTANYDPFCVGGVEDQHIIFPDTIVGLPEHNNQDIVIFPNPVSEKLSIEFSNSFSGRITFSDISGRVLDKIVLENNIETQYIDVSGYSSGLYILDFMGKNGAVKGEKIILR